MPVRPLRKANISVERGAWGEAVATAFLRSRGLEILECNSRPCKYDRRLEIDIIAYDRKVDVVVFVEVKQHAGRSQWQRRMRSVDKRKLGNLRRACNAWRWKNSYSGSFRFDVVEIYGSPGSEMPQIDHIKRVRLFERAERFVRWTDEGENDEN